jgi:hypothetical protein
VWDVLLTCGHIETQFIDPAWKPGDVPIRYTSKRRLSTILKVCAEDEDDEEYYRRMHAESWPNPAPFARCDTCGKLRSVVAYERVGWVKPKPKPPQPRKPPSRKSMETRLRKLERESEQLREQLKRLKE